MPVKPAELEAGGPGDQGTGQSMQRDHIYAWLTRDQISTFFKKKDRETKKEG